MFDDKIVEYELIFIIGLTLINRRTLIVVFVYSAKGTTIQYLMR